MGRSFLRGRWRPFLFAHEGAVATDRQSVHLKKQFLDAFAQHGNVSAAARAAGVGRSTVYQWQEHDEDFAAAFREAEILARDAVDEEIHRRGVLGWDDPVYQGGARVGTIRKFSDTLLIFLAKGLMPEKYKDRVEHSGQIAAPVKAFAGFDPSEV